MSEPKERDQRVAVIRRHAAEFLDQLRRVDPDMLVKLSIEMRSDQADGRLRLELNEGLPPLPFDKAPFDKAPPFKDAPFRDTPWHDRVRPPNKPIESITPIERRERTRSAARAQSVKQKTAKRTKQRG